MSEKTDYIKNIWKDKVNSLGYTLASSLMNSQYPREFECYQLTLELTNSSGETLDYFSFPVMPSELNISERMIASTQNTFGGVSSISSSVYTPKSIVINGNFGRKFWYLNRGNFFSSLFRSYQVERDYGANISLNEKELNRDIKTGYGCIKVLQSIINRSLDVDKNGNINKLYLYNLAFGESYLIKVLSMDFNQNVGSNAIWNYSLKIETVCPLYLEKGYKPKMFSKNEIQLGVNTLVKEVRDILKI